MTVSFGTSRIAIKNYKCLFWGFFCPGYGCKSTFEPMYNSQLCVGLFLVFFRLLGFFTLPFAFKMVFKFPQQFSHSCLIIVAL